MNKKTIFIIFLALIAAVAAYFVFLKRGETGFEEAKVPPPTAYYYNNPEISLENIQIKAFYFVPKNRTENIYEGWRGDLKSGLESLANFHEQIFRGSSKISFDIFPAPVIGEKESIFYDGENTARGNSQALVRVAEELDRRAFEDGGDLFDDYFSAQKEGAFPVMLVFYEGVGAVGGAIYESEAESVEELAARLGLPKEIIFKTEIKSAEGIFLVSRNYLSDESIDFGESVLAHEFYHTLGAPDHYDLDSGKPFSLDIMGLGVERSFSANYLDNEILENMGI